MTSRAPRTQSRAMGSDGVASATNSCGWLAVILLRGAELRFYAITYGLPAVFNADEPHLVNVAVSFGAGSLNPHFFKYPTLWMYTLAFAYGIYFAIWSGMGVWHGVRQF